MNETNIIDFVIDKIVKCPSIKFNKKSNTELEIFCHDKNGFNIYLQTNHRESTLYFGAFHWHFDFTEYETNEMLNQLLFGLSGITRLKEFSKNGKAYKWKLEVQDKDGNWLDNGTMGTIKLNFWKQANIKYFQNNLIPKSILYVDNEEKIIQ